MCKESREDQLIRRPRIQLMLRGLAEEETMCMESKEDQLNRRPRVQLALGGSAEQETTCTVGAGRIS